MLSSDDGDGSAFALVPFLVAFPLLFAVAIGHAVLSIVGAVKASHMEMWRYPVNLRLVKP